MVKRIYFLLIILFIMSCAVRNDKYFLIKAEEVEGKSIELDTSGFFYAKSVYLNTNPTSKKNYDSIRSILPLILYRNGLVIYSGNRDGITNSYCTSKIYQVNRNTFAESLVRYKDYLSFLKMNIRVLNSCQIKGEDIAGKGLFKIENDSIKIQYYDSESIRKTKYSNNAYYLHELRGKVINRKLFIINEHLEYRNMKVEPLNLVFFFEKDENKPIIKNYFSK